jgi:peptidoglycan/xylan/chitin deacetylase (PgdA/CDA1 family)
VRTIAADNPTRTARLLFDADLAAARVHPGDLTGRALLRSVRATVPSSPRRLWQRLAMKYGHLSGERHAFGRLEDTRRRVLGADGAAPPRFLVRVDEFPHWLGTDHPEHFGTDPYRRFHDVMASAGVPYLIAVVPRPAPNPEDPHDDRRRDLDEREREMLASLPADGVELGLHGLDHRTRDTRPRHHAELLGLAPDALAQRLDEGIAVLDAIGHRPRVLVPPFNRFGFSQWPVLASRFDVITGGPESVRHLGLQPTPVWLDDAVYLPSYEPYYDAAAHIGDAARAAVARGAGTWIPIVLHWGWEIEDDFAGLRRLLDVIAPHASRWDEFLAAAERSALSPPTSAVSGRVTP